VCELGACKSANIPKSAGCPEKVNGAYIFNTEQDYKKALKVPCFSEKLKEGDILKIEGRVYIFLFIVW
jgi:hypothetical protein